MPKQKFKVMAQIVAYRTVTVMAEDGYDAVAKAAARLERAGHETVGALRYESIPEISQ